MPGWQNTRVTTFVLFPHFHLFISLVVIFFVLFCFLALRTYPKLHVRTVFYVQVRDSRVCAVGVQRGGCTQTLCRKRWVKV